MPDPHDEIDTPARILKCWHTAVSVALSKRLARDMVIMGLDDDDDDDDEIDTLL